MRQRITLVWRTERRSLRYMPIPATARRPPSYYRLVTPRVSEWLILPALLLTVQYSKPCRYNIRVLFPIGISNTCPKSIQYMASLQLVYNPKAPYAVAHAYKHRAAVNATDEMTPISNMGMLSCALLSCCLALAACPLRALGLIGCFLCPLGRPCSIHMEMAVL